MPGAFVPVLLSGSLSGSISLAVQWQRDTLGDHVGVDISGATSVFYTPVLADVNSNLRCKVTATNDVGSTTAFTSWVGPVAATPTKTQTAKARISQTGR